MKIRKLITLSEEQAARMTRLMAEVGQDSPSAFVSFLMFMFEENQRRPVGRHKSSEDDAN